MMPLRNDAEAWLWLALTVFASVFLALILLTGCAWLAGRDPAVAAYGVERARCVTDHDAAAEARACFARVDARYAKLRDGGAP